jgi:hypothetical protein
MREPNASDYLPDPSKQFFGPGTVCSKLSISIGQLRTLMDAAGVRFAASLDGVGLLDGDGFDAVAAECRRVREEIEQAGRAARERN